MGLSDSIASTIQEGGRIRASQAGARGQIYGQALSRIGQMVSEVPAMFEEAQTRSLQQQRVKMEMAQDRRKAAAASVIQQATSAAVKPDGTIDTSLLTQHLAGTVAADQIPDIQRRYQLLDNERLDGLRTKGLLADSEDEHIALAAHAADAFTDPTDKGAALAANIGSLLKRGLVTPERAADVVGRFVDQNQQPIPDKIGQTINGLVSGSQKALTAISLEQQREENVRIAGERAAAAKEQADQKVFTTELGRYANLLHANAKDQASYAATYAKVPERYQVYFDHPNSWTAESGADALEATLSNQDRIRLAAERRMATQAQQTAARNAQTDATRARTEAMAEARLSLAQKADQRAADKAEADAKSKADKEHRDEYGTWVKDYEKQRDEERRRAQDGVDENGNPTGMKAIPPHVPPPTMEKWDAMTPDERQRVVYDPSVRISDAELRRRSAAPSAPTPAAGQTPAPAAQAKAQPYTPPKDGETDVVVNGQHWRLNAQQIAALKAKGFTLTTK